MKTLGRAMIVGMVAFAASAQGPLTPPGAPAPGMKTLDQVEARTAISGPVTISRPGSYYLTTNIVITGSVAGINVHTNDVSIDLNGFSVQGDRDSANGIYIGTGVQNCSIEHGTVHGCYFNGIYALSASNCSFVDLTIVNNARYSIAYDGIKTGAKARVERCRILNNGGDGLDVRGGSWIVNNTIIDNGYVGLRLSETMSYVHDNIVRGNVDNYRLVADNHLNLLLCEIPETIDWPCSVKLAGTLTCLENGTNGITVNADNVTIDLDGHTLVGPGALSGCGVYQERIYKGLVVRDGKAIGWSGAGQAGFRVDGDGTQLFRLQAVTNYYGIHARWGWGCTISDCVALSNQKDGILADYGSTLSGCVATDNEDMGIIVGGGNMLRGCATRHNRLGILVGGGNSLNDCVASYNTAVGIYAGDGNTFAGCTVLSNRSDGIVLFDGNRISGCAANFNYGDGFRLGIGNLFIDNLAQGNMSNGIACFRGNRIEENACIDNGYFGTGCGIFVSNSDNRIDDNTCTENDRGVVVSGSGNFIARNTCSGNRTNWDILAGNVCLVVSGVTSGAISGNAGGTAPGSTDPNANFTF